MTKSSENEKPLNLNINMPAIASDGNAISMNSNGDVSLIFFQLLGQSDDAVNASAVANIRINADQLRQLDKSIKTVLERIEHQEDPKSSKS